MVRYTYDDPLVAFSKGRLTKIERDGHEISYEWSVFGEMTRDGELTYQHDANGNREEVGYPGGVSAHYTFDFADREATLEVAVPGEPVQPVVTSSSYLPLGPLATLALGNGLTETRTHDARYYPDRITVAGATPLLDWDYTVDAIGNPTAITDLLSSSQNRTYGYQDYQYFLTLGNGPWGNLSWAYDKIGGRTRETRDALTDVYSYVPNMAGGHSPKLSQIQLGAGGTKLYSFDPAGNQTQVATGADVVQMSYDDASQLASIERPAAGVRSEMLYDGRGFLRHAEEIRPALIFEDGFETGDSACWSSVVGGVGGGTCPGSPMVAPVYSSEGVLRYQLKPTTRQYVFYLAGRPVTLLLVHNGSSLVYRFVVTDHLGTPSATFDSDGDLAWSGGFEPFGGDYGGAQAGMPVLRLPGQWSDEAWEVSGGGELIYNLHRWFLYSDGKYSQPDPFGVSSDIGMYRYAENNPLRQVDPLGLVALFVYPPTHQFVPQRDLPCGVFGCTTWDIDFDCSCDCFAGAYYLRLRLAIKFDIYSPSEPHFSQASILREESKHVQVLTRLARYIAAKASDLERTPLSRGACEAHCVSLKDELLAALRLNNFWVDISHMFSSPYR